MDLRLTPTQEAFRDQIRTWLEANVPAEAAPYGDGLAMRDFDCAWQKQMSAAGWAGVSWPQEYGGRGLSLDEQLIWHEEYARAHAPYTGSLFVALNHAGPTIAVAGTAEQRARYLPPILSGDEVWCQGFSEPEAGSDLASLRTVGRIVGDTIVVNGRKIWSSYANAADFQELLVRTDADAESHAGALSWLICDMRSPGIRTEPIPTIDGAATFCEVTYEDVEIPVANVVGGLGNGWRVAMTTFGFERGTAFMAEQVALRVMVEELATLVAVRRNSAGNRSWSRVESELAEIRAEVLGLRAMTYMAVSRISAEGGPNARGSMLRLYWSELLQRVCSLAMDALGWESLAAWSELHRHAQQWSNDYLYSFSRTISAGTKDVQRGIIGERVLGLPKDPLRRRPAPAGPAARSVPDAQLVEGGPR